MTAAKVISLPGIATASECQEEFWRRLAVAETEMLTNGDGPLVDSLLLHAGRASLMEDRALEREALIAAANALEEGR